MKNLVKSINTLILAAVIITSCTPTAVPVVGCTDNIVSSSLGTGLLAYYKFPTATAGNLLNDFGANGFTLTNVGGVVSDLDRTGLNTSSMRFNGTNYLLAPASFPNITTSVGTPFTVMVTYKPDAALIIPQSKHPILIGQICGPIIPSILTNPFSSPNFILAIDSAKVVSSTLAPNNAYSSSPYNLVDNAWHNAAVSWDGINTVTVYQFNPAPGSGITYSQTKVGTALASTCTSANTIIGYGFNGIIDDVKIWNRLLTAAEMMSAYSYDSPNCP
jgi:Concanavalin A-like lectin/glucanases superfamily